MTTDIIKNTTTTSLPAAETVEEHRDLALIDTARTALSEVRSLYDAKDLRDKLVAIEEYTRRRGGLEESERLAREMRLRVERLMGEFTREMEKAQGKRTDRTSHSANAKCEATKEQALKAIGINRDVASKFERIAAIPAERFEEEVKKPEATTRSLAQVGGQHRPRRGGRKPQAQPQPAPRPSRADAPEWAFQRRAQMFRGHVEQLTMKVFEKWPAQVMAPLLTAILRQVADQLDERARRKSLA